ncbi:hypothetical protein LIER_22589 [Lithospermum erythrorhizon]|uniref:Uncharacterized protein n=1 Tax=Lithospermum erythrorhizon TaxID=34254 RepID=A0AAV3QUG0_LITER
MAPLSTKAEYMYVSSAVVELTWIQFLLCDLQIMMPTTPIAYCDNIATTYLSYNPVMHSQTKHISIDYYFVREKVAFCALKVVHVPTSAQFVDVFTKSFSGPKFKQAIANLCRLQSPTGRD